MSASYINIPITYMVSETLKLNVNGGWFYDVVNVINYATYGADFEWIPVKDGPVTLLAEVFGLVGERTDPRSRIEGLRYTPMETVNLDLIYGRKIGGENANWITLGLNLRFPAPKK